jgi:hypothetical protein
MKVFNWVDFFHRDECCVELITITSIRNKDKKVHTLFFHQMWHNIGYKTTGASNQILSSKQLTIRCTIS